MPARPGDSAPDFHRIEENLQSPPSEPTAGQAADEQGLPDSHVFQMPMMIPHHSDGSTDILKRGRDEDAPVAQDATEPLFPQPQVPESDETDAVDDEVTMQLDPVQTAGVDSSPVSARADSSAAAVAADQPPARPASIPAPQRAVESSAGPVNAGGNWFTILLLSYASAVTIGLVYLLMTRGDSSAQQEHQLESLRDPVDEEGTVRIYQRGVELPGGHILRLAEGRRFGNIRIEPLRVTQGPLQFEHYSKSTRLQQSPSAPVLKLWLRLTNVSGDQSIAPLDALLMFKRELNRDGELVSNTYVCRSGAAATESVVFAYPASQNSEWDIVSQQLGQKLAPGESLDTFIPSDADGLAELTGDLEWRFHLRKGYAPSGRGVTTLVEVEFNSSDIELEPALATSTQPESKPKKSGKRKS